MDNSQNTGNFYRNLMDTNSSTGSQQPFPIGNQQPSFAQQQNTWMMNMMMQQTENCSFLTKENKRLVEQNFQLQKETFGLREEIQNLKSELAKHEQDIVNRKAVQETIGTQTGTLGNMPFSQYIVSGAQASTSIRLGIQDAIERYKIRLRGKSTKAAAPPFQTTSTTQNRR